MFGAFHNSIAQEINTVAINCDREILKIQKLLDDRCTGVHGDLTFVREEGAQNPLSQTLEVYLWVDVVLPEKVVAKPFPTGNPSKIFGEYPHAITEADQSAVLVASALTLTRIRDELRRAAYEIRERMDEACYIGVADDGGC